MKMKLIFTRTVLHLVHLIIFLLLYMGHVKFGTNNLQAKWICLFILFIYFHFFKKYVY